MKLGELASAGQYREALGGFRKLQEQPGTPRWLRAASEYEIAELQAALHENEGAMAALGRSVQLGYDDCLTPRSSKHLASIVANPKARQALAAMKIAEADLHELAWLQREAAQAVHEASLMITDNINRVDQQPTEIPQSRLPTRSTTSPAVLYWRQQLLMAQRAQREYVKTSDEERMVHAADDGRGVRAHRNRRCLNPPASAGSGGVPEGGGEEAGFRPAIRVLQRTKGLFPAWPDSGSAYPAFLPSATAFCAMVDCSIASLRAGAAAGDGGGGARAATSQCIASTQAHAAVQPARMSEGKCTPRYTRDMPTSSTNSSAGTDTPPAPARRPGQQHQRGGERGRAHRVAAREAVAHLRRDRGPQVGAQPGEVVLGAQVHQQRTDHRQHEEQRVA
jgi:hypothetical protein